MLDKTQSEVDLQTCPNIAFLSRICISDPVLASFQYEEKSKLMHLYPSLNPRMAPEIESSIAGSF